MAAADAEAQVVSIVNALSGEQLCSLELPAAAAVLDVKRALQERLGVNALCQRLLHGPQQEPLRDDCALEQLSKGSGRPDVLQLRLVKLRYEEDPRLSEQLLEGALLGDAQEVEQILRRPACPDSVSPAGMPPLIAASEQGHAPVVQLLCEAGADLNRESEDGTAVTPMLVAARMGHHMVASLLSAAGAAVDKPGPDGATPLYEACDEGHQSVAQLLLKLGADPDRARRDGSTPLFIASRNGHLEIARLLCEVGADKDRALPDGSTPLMAACEGLNLRVVALLCEAGADKDRARRDGSTPLGLACGMGELPLARALCEAGADKDRAVWNGRLGRLTTPLVTAVSTGHLPLARLLLEAGADKDWRLQDGSTALHEAVLCKSFVVRDVDRPDLVRLLCEAGADTEVEAMADGEASLGPFGPAGPLFRRGATPLARACQASCAPTVQALLAARADVNRASWDGEDSLPPLCYAVRESTADAVRLLCEAGANKDLASPLGRTPLLVAAASRDRVLPSARLLCELGADKDLAAWDGEDTAMPLHWAAGEGSLGVVRILLEAGADRDRPTQAWRCTPLIAAVEGGHLEVLRCLLEAGADRDRAMANGLTPLAIAAEQNDREAVQQLCGAGADVGAASSDGATPLQRASERGHLEVVRILEEARARASKRPRL